MRINFTKIAWSGIAVWLISKILDSAAKAEAHRPHAHTFSIKNFDGNYAFQITGLSSFYSTNENTVATGVMIANGKGNLSGHGVFRDGTYLHGWISCYVAINGVYRC